MGERPLPARVLYSQAEAAELLNMSTKRLVERVREGALRFVLDGKRRKFTLADLEAYAESCRAGGAQWGSTAGRTRHTSGGRSRSTVVAFADVVARHRARKRKTS